MTEKQWLNARTAAALLDHHAGRGANRRKLRLLAIACARRMLPALPADRAFAGLVDAAEAYADDPSLRDSAVAARKPVREAARQHARGTRSQPLDAAMNVLIDLTNDAIEGFTAGILNAVHVIGHRNAAVTADIQAERRIQADYLRDIFGNPFHPVAFDPSWRTSTVIALAQQMYDSRDFGLMPILGDALQDAGCESEDILAHCRDANGTHVRGCWVVDLALGKS